MNISKEVNYKVLLFLILLIAAILRLYMLGSFPVHLTNDEAALGYNAYSIFKTGRDEHGQIMPIFFKSFGDWKPGLYVYLTIPSVAIFGLTEFATRLPSALSGILAVWLVYLIGENLFNKKVALFASASLAVMPWHVHFSRGAWEANLALTLLLLGVYFLIWSFEKHRRMLLSAVFFGATLWTYQSAKIASLLPLAAMLPGYRKEIFSNKNRWLSSAIVIGLLFSVPVFLSLINGKGGRLEVMSVFSYPRPESYIQQTVFDHENISKSSAEFLLFHSEALSLSRGVVGRYLNYFSGKFLFFEGDWSNPKHTSVDTGYLLYASIPILILGAWSVLKKLDKKPYLFIFLWLVLAPIPAALTRDSAHGVRALNLVIPISFVLGIGFYEIYKYFAGKSIIIKLSVLALFSAVFLYSMAIYLDAYYIQSPAAYARDYLYGYKQTVQELNKVKDKYDKIVFDQSFDQPYIYFLFFNKYDPAKYQHNLAFQEGVAGDVGFVRNLESIEFRPINWSADKYLKNTLLVGKPTAFPPSEVDKAADYNVERISYPDGNDAFLLVDPL